MEENWNAKTCLSRDWGNARMDQNDTEPYSLQMHCSPIWDGLLCWPPTMAGSIASSGCPSFKGSDTTQFAFRVCSPSGEWQDRDGIPSPTGWTNYTSCLTPEIREIMRRLGTDDDAQEKFNIAENTRTGEFVGLSLSLGALLLSLLIFYYFRNLRNSRTRLHCHLFIAMVIQVGIRLIVYSDQAITRSFGSDQNTNANVNLSTLSLNLSETVNGNSQTDQHRGIDNTPILCEASYICLEYARTAMFMWMFVEGLFLHNMVTVTVFEDKLSPLVYSVIGWILPIPLTVAWAIATHLHYGTATCWWGYNFTGYFWILEGPRLAVLMVNFIFLLNILRVLVMKLRQSNSSETQQAMKAVKAALLLLPLLGLTNLLNMFDAPLENSPFQFAMWSYTTHLLTSTQGLIVATLYCFRNGEVQLTLRKFIRINILRSSKHIVISKKPMSRSAFNNRSFYHGCSDIAGSTRTINMINPLKFQETTMTIMPNGDSLTPTVSSANEVSHIDYLNECDKNKVSFSSQNGSNGNAPAQSPVIVRSFNNGIQTLVSRDNSYEDIQCQYYNNNLSLSREFYQQNSSAVHDDLHEQKTKNIPHKLPVTKTAYSSSFHQCHPPSISNAMPDTFSSACLSVYSINNFME